MLIKKGSGKIKIYDLVSWQLKCKKGDPERPWQRLRVFVARCCFLAIAILLFVIKKLNNISALARIIFDFRTGMHWIFVLTTGYWVNTNLLQGQLSVMFFFQILLLLSKPQLLYYYYLLLWREVVVSSYFFSKFLDQQQLGSVCASIFKL